MDQPLVSVVIPAYNAAETIAQAIASVQAQSLPDWEMIVVNDGSKDSTGNVLADLVCAEPRLRIIDQANAGAGAARNAGIAASRGRFIKLLDADDRLEPNCLEALLPAAREHGASCGAWTIDDAKGQPLGISVPVPRGGVGLDALLERNPIAPSACLLSRECMSLESFGSGRAAIDYDLWLRLARHGVVWQSVSQTVARYRLMPSSISTNSAALLGEIARILREAYRLAADDLRIDASPQRLAGVLRGHALRYATLYALQSPSLGQDDAADLFESVQAGSVEHAVRNRALSSEAIGDAGFEGVLCVLSGRPDLSERSPHWASSLCAWWRAIREEGWASGDFWVPATERFAQRMTSDVSIVEQVLKGVEHEVVLIGHGANGRAVEQEAVRRGLRVSVRDDRYEQQDSDAPDNAEPMDAPISAGATVIVTPLNDTRLVHRFPSAVRWRICRDRLAKLHAGPLRTLLAPNLAA